MYVGIGLSITISVTELATRNVISGTTRIFGAILSALQLGFGIAIGTSSLQNFISTSYYPTCY